MDNLEIFAAKYLIAVPILATLYIIWKLSAKRNELNKFIAMLLAGGLLSLIFAKIGNHFYYHPRPFIGDGVKPLFYASRDNGFPSDHTLLASFLGFAALSYSRRLGAVLLVIAAIVGWARVAAGVHHLSDIIGSFVFTGLAYLVISRLVAAKKKTHKQKTPAS
jgi:membrane-associated phospholipid phosphatase